MEFNWNFNFEYPCRIRLKLTRGKSSNIIQIFLIQRESNLWIYVKTDISENLNSKTAPIQQRSSPQLQNSMFTLYLLQRPNYAAAIYKNCIRHLPEQTAIRSLRF